MNSILKVSRFVHKFPTNYLIPARFAYVNNYTPYMPKPYPKTQKEREEAARRYGLEIEEYEPYPDDGDGLGDYPKLPYISLEARDPNYPWDYPESRRNFNEPLHNIFHVTGGLQFNVDKRLAVSKLRMFKFMFIYVLGGFSLLYYIGSQFPLMKRVTKKHDPFSGKTFYSFELE